MRQHFPVVLQRIVITKTKVQAAFVLRHVPHFQGALPADPQLLQDQNGFEDLTRIGVRFQKTALNARLYQLRLTVFRQRVRSALSSLSLLLIQKFYPNGGKVYDPLPASFSYAPSRC